MTIGIWILGDRLNQEQSALVAYQNQKERTPVILIESLHYAQTRPYHQQKLVLIWSAMRHFASELEVDGWSVSYEIAEDFAEPLQCWIKDNQITKLVITQPCDRPFGKYIQSLHLDCPINFIPDNHFLWSRTEFSNWAESRKRLLMEDFYREGRKKFNILMEEGKPIGGKWNYDKQNRKPPKKNLLTPQRLWFKPDQITQQVIEQIKQQDFIKYGKIESFNWGVTRKQAQQVLEHFIAKCLPNFGTYQDAMITGEYTMWHSLISPYLNIGLLYPWEVIKAAETAYYENHLPINSVEGFIRQVLGWREYMHGIYQYTDEKYIQSNWFEHSHPLPKFFWDGKTTEMNCLRQSLTQIENTGYAHHIQRLMVLSNFALIAGINPQEVENWFHSAFIDAYDWVMQTNVLGMGQFADGGMLASKPYAASANYINKMSDYCNNCSYNKSDRATEKACPFNYFYWNFIFRHRDKLKSLGRMNLILGNLKKIPEAELNQMNLLAEKWWNEN